MSKYEITKFRSMTNEVRYAIYSREEHGFFAGSDFMGSVIWKQIQIPDEECELTAEDDPWQIVKDLESSDEPTGHDKPPARKLEVIFWGSECGNVFEKVYTESTSEAYEAVAQAIDKNREKYPDKRKAKDRLFSILQRLLDNEIQAAGDTVYQISTVSE